MAKLSTPILNDIQQAFYLDENNKAIMHIQFQMNQLVGLNEVDAIYVIIKNAQTNRQILEETVPFQINGAYDTIQTINVNVVQNNINTFHQNFNIGSLYLLKYSKALMFLLSTVFGTVTENLNLSRLYFFRIFKIYS